MLVPLIITLLLPPRVEPPRPAGSDAAVATLPRRVVHDLRRLVTTVPLLTLAIGGGAAGAVHPADAATDRRLAKAGALDEALDAGGMAGNGFVQTGGAAAVYAIGLLAHQPRVARLGTELLEAQAVEALMTRGLKPIANRTRPDGGRQSFPSGHAAATFATADVFAQAYGWKVGVPAYAGAAYVAISRLTERQHFLSDVVFGTAIGIAASRSVAVQTRTSSTTIAPMIVPRGAGVIIVRTRR
jgi:membrane-associated phospholipid phosphatase